VIVKAAAVIALLVGAIALARADALVPKDTIISLQRGACERRCAVYKVMLFSDGTTVFAGQYFVKKSGATLLHVSPGEIGSFLDHVERAGFFDMRNSYGIGSNEGCSGIDEDDAPIAIISISEAGRAKTIVHHHRCLGPEPERLTRLEAEIDNLVDAKRFYR
jgi:hypothetical protein